MSGSPVNCSFCPISFPKSLQHIISPTGREESYILHIGTFSIPLDRMTGSRKMTRRYCP